MKRIPPGPFPSTYRQCSSARNDFVRSVERALRDSDLPPRELSIEVTESMLMNDIDMAIHHLRRLRQLGVQVAVDDFGTGHSSLAYLQRLPLDVLKIDRCFVNDLDAAPDKAEPAKVLAEMIASLGRNLGLGLLAEGVETPTQRDTLIGLGCQQAQGFLFARPMPARQLEAFVAH